VLVENSSHLGSHIAEVTSTVEEDVATVDSCGASCQDEDVGDHIFVAETDRGHRHAYDAGGQIAHDNVGQRILLEYEAAKGEMAQQKDINQQLMIDSTKKSDEVRRLQLRKDADLQELKDKTDDELRHFQVTRNDELPRMGEELTRLRKIQEGD
jgi:hypothetical protein